MQNTVSEWTLIIPTFCRPEFLRRSLSYYQATVSVGLKVIVVDSSPEAFAQQNINLIENIKSRRLLISYLRADPSDQLFQKIKMALDVCETDYVGLVADDDLLLVGRAHFYIDILIHRSDIFSASGMVAKLNLDDLASSKRWSMKTFPQNLSVSASDRVGLQCHWLTTYLWSFYRTHQLQDLLNILSTVAPDRRDAFSEYFLYFLMVVTGKISRGSHCSYVMVRHSTTETAKRAKLKESERMEQSEIALLGSEISNKALLEHLSGFYSSKNKAPFPENIDRELRRFFGLGGGKMGFARTGDFPKDQNDGTLVFWFSRLAYLLACCRMLYIGKIPIAPSLSTWLAFRDRKILRNALRHICTD